MQHSFRVWGVLKLYSQMLSMKYSFKLNEARVLSEKQNREFHGKSIGTEDIGCEFIINSSGAVHSGFG